jgi:hypothetical protein
MKLLLAFLAAVITSLSCGSHTEVNTSHNPNTQDNSQKIEGLGITRRSTEDSVFNNNSSVQTSPVVSEGTPSRTRSPDGWHHATFKGISVGIDSRARVLQILGNPLVSTKQKENDFEGMELWDHFVDLDEINKSVNVVSSVETNIVRMIVSTPEDLSVEKAISIFGDNFRRVRYSSRSCADGSGEIFEKQNGELMFIEYGDKGIILNLDSSEMNVTEIEYRGPSKFGQQRKCR